MPVPAPSAAASCMSGMRGISSCPRFAGWWGHDKAERFLYDPRFDPIDGAQGWQISNPPILSTAPLLASLEIFQRAGMRALREKSIALTGIPAAADRGSVCRDWSRSLRPTPPEQRGCQLSLRIARARRRGKALPGTARRRRA